MAEENNETEEIVEKLKDRGLTCSRLNKKIDQQLSDAKEFRSYGFVNIAEAEEKIAEKLKKLKQNVCRLK